MASFFSDEFMRSALSHPLFRPRIISEDDYDITPKKSFIERQILQLRENINTITRIRDRTYQRYNQDIEELEAKIAELEGSTKKRGTK